MAAALACASVVALGAGRASAMDSEVTSDTAAQAYDVRSPTGETVLARRRLTTTLGIGVYNLLDAPMGDMHAPELSFRARLRYDADYGVSGSEVDPNNPNALTPGVYQGLVDLMYGYVEGRRFLGGWLGFKLGRQYQTDALGWWAFDGAEVSAMTPFFVKAEAYGGLEERGGLPLSTSRFESDGVFRGNRTGYDPSLWPQYQPSAIAPAFGVAVESTGVSWIHGRLTYRRVYDTGASNTSEFSNGLYAPVVYDGTRISSDRLGYALDVKVWDYGAVRGGVVYDFYDGLVSQLYGTLEGYAGKRVTISADYDYYQPTFDADSIWNFFAAEPMNDVGLRANWDVTDRVSVAGGGHLRVYQVETQPLSNSSTYSPYPNYAPGMDLFPTNGHPMDEGANLSARYRSGNTLATLRGAGNFGDAGDRVGADLAGQHVFENRYVASVRTGVWQWQDNLRPDRDATSFQYVLGLGYKFAPRAQTMFEWEHDMNRLVGQRLRLMLWLSIAVGK